MGRVPPRIVTGSEAAEARAWDSFLGERSGVHFEQTSAWGALRKVYGWNPTWVWSERGGEILGGAIILTRRIGLLGTIGYVDRGPIWAAHEPDSEMQAMEALCQFARSRRLTYFVVVPPYRDQEMISFLRSQLFRVKPERLPPTGVGKATLLIDLRPDLDAILAGMSMTKRQNIRRGLRKGVKVRVGDGADAGTVRRLMWQSCQRRGLSPAPPQKDFFDNLWRELGPGGGVKFFIAEVEGEPVSAACVMLSGGAMYLWRVGWSGEYVDFDPNDVLHWEAIKWGKEHGFREFDFMHIRPDHAKAIIQGGKLKDSYSGVTDYKMGFGGQLRLLPELYYRSYNPIIHRALSLGAEQLLDSGSGIKLLRSVSQKVRNFGMS